MALVIHAMIHARRIFSCASIVAAVVVVLGGCRTGEPALIDVTLDHDDGSTGVTYSGNRAVIEVSDPRGINGLSAVLKSDRWPEEIVIRLPLNGLESLEIQYGNFTIATGRSSNESPDPPLMLSVTDEAGNVQTASPSADMYYPDINRTADGFEIFLPPHFFREDYTSFSMRWIDYYR